eukprot:1187512-Prorocentrum_minimum.AAC.1
MVRRLFGADVDARVAVSDYWGGPVFRGGPLPTRGLQGCRHRLPECPGWHVHDSRALGGMFMIHGESCSLPECPRWHVHDS